MEHFISKPFDGDVHKALELASSVLTYSEFRMISKTASSMEFAGPGMLMYRRNPFSGVSKIAITHQNGELQIHSELGGLRQIRRFLILLPLGMGLFFATLFGFLFHQMGLAFTISISIAPLAPWLVLSPILTRLFRSRTLKALSTLLDNMVLGSSSYSACSNDSTISSAGWS